jgi:hypothetical protein
MAVPASFENGSSRICNRFAQRVVSPRRQPGGVYVKELAEIFYFDDRSHAGKYSATG